MARRSALINVMVAAASKAGRALVRDFGEVEQLQVSKKGPADFVSIADTKAEKILFQELQKARPEFGFLMEEQGVIEGDGEHCWIIDPLDGTSNFLHGIPHFAISIALEKAGELVAGVIYAPIQDEMFWAEKGQGAFLNGRRLRVSGRNDMAESLFATGVPFLGRPDHELFLKQLAGIMAVTAGVRRFGSAALDLAYVAAGRFDGFWETGIKPWDMAAGIVLVREAGGFVSDISGKKAMLDTGSVICANEHLIRPLSKVVTHKD
ncbi:MAG: inositol monophosphatase [Rhodospirillales bacterium]|nr:inositol monophosphatase [Rhodospirillales bacterium]